MESIHPISLPRAAAIWRIARFILAIAVLVTLGVSLFLPGKDYRHFAFLADAFAHRTYTVNHLPADYADKVIWENQTYLPLAPLPAILLLPLTATFGFAFDELWLAYLFTGANVLGAWLLLKRLRVPREFRWTLLALFFCGTIYLADWSTGRSWWLAHILATTFLLLAIDETLTRRRAWLIGAWLGLAFLSRAPTIFATPFFVWLLKPADQSWREWRWLISTGTQLALGFALPALFFFDYNYARFGSPFETGYRYAHLATLTLAAALQQGMFSPVHLAKNLYALLLAAPLAYPSFPAPVLQFPYVFPSPWGMSIFLTTPAFIYIFAANWRERIVRAAWLAVGLVLLPLVLYYGVGWYQFGYRYALDLYPFLFVLTALGIKTMTRARWLIVASIAINVWGAWWQMLGFRALPPELFR